MKFRRLEDAKLKGKTALVRVDFNVPRTKDGAISDDTRLQAAVPTIKALQKAGAKTILLSHYGRPKGKPDPELSLRFIVGPLAEALESEVLFTEKLTEPVVQMLKEGEVMVIENTRFAKAETCLLYTSPSPRDATLSRMPSSA